MRTIVKKVLRPVGLFVAMASVVALPFSMDALAASSATEHIRNGYNQTSDDINSERTNLVTGDDSVLKTVINTMLFIVGVLAVAMIIFSGIRYITAHGDKGQIESAKNTLIYSVVGLVIAIIAYAIVNWVIGIFRN